MKPTPVLDSRQAGDVLTELMADTPGYLRYGRLRPNRSGFALLQIASRFCFLVINAINGAAGKAELAFLDATGIDIGPPQAARVPVVFSLNPDSPVDPALPQNSQVAAPPAPTLPGSIAPPPSATAMRPRDPTVFATDEEIALSRASLVSLYSTYPDVDQFADHSASIQSGFRLYDPLQPVVHHLYLGHDALLALAGSVDVSLDFQLQRELPATGTTKSGKPKLPRGLKVAWEYAAAGDWVSFDPVDDHTYGLSLEGEVQLHKRSGPQSSPVRIDGVNSYWLRARVETPLPLIGSKDQLQLPSVASIRVRLALNHDKLPCDVAFADDIRVDTSKDFFPFGAQPGVASSFVMACDQAFSQEGARIGINLGFTGARSVTPSSDLALLWEYSVGAGLWQGLSGGGDAQFRDNTTNLSQPTTLDPSISFTRPRDWAKVAYNGEEHFWLRVRITTGDYGKPPAYSIVSNNGTWNITATDGPQPPSISSIAFAYSFQIGPFVPDHCLALNGFGYQDFTDACRWGQQPFLPFTPLPDRNSAVYFGFSKALPIGLVSMYLNVPGRIATAPKPSSYTWEYQVSSGWAELAVLDQTSGFTRSGLVQLIGQPDAIPGPGPAGSTYWLRARLKEAGDPDPSPIGAVYLNSIWATQRQSVQGEVLGRSDGSPRQAMLTLHAPVLKQQLLEVQEWSGTGNEWESLFAGLGSPVRYLTDPRGKVTAVWVMWEERPYLYLSGAQDRHYVIERSTGLVRFGNGTQGMVPPPGRPVMLSYDYGGGVVGNVSAQSITQLHSAVPYLQSLTNPIDAAGGAAGESAGQVRRRGPQRLRNSGRSVAAADYEWLAHEASPEVAIARCLATTGPDGGGEPGWVTLVIVPQSESLQPQPSQELLSRVEQAIATEAPVAIAGQIRVVGPAYKPVSVMAEVVVNDAGRAAEIEDAIGAALNSFLHPLTGGTQGIGWEFGQTVHLSQVVHVVLATNGVASAPHVSLLSDTEIYTDAVPIPAGALPSPGKHELKLSVQVS